MAGLLKKLSLTGLFKQEKKEKEEEEKVHKTKKIVKIKKGKKNGENNVKGAKKKATPKMRKGEEDEDVETPEGLEGYLDTEITATESEAEDEEEMEMEMEMEIEIEIENENENENEKVEKTKAKAKEREKAIKDQQAVGVKQVLEMEDKEVTKLTEIFCLPPKRARELCEKMAWNTEKVQEYLLAGNDADDDHGNAHVDDIPVVNKKQKKSKADLITCNVCSEQVRLEDTLSLKECPGGDHRFCLSCWETYTKLQVKEGKRVIQCLAEGCTNHLTDASIIKQFLKGDEKLLSLYQYLDATHFMQKSKRMRWCPSPSCNKAVTGNSDGIVQCDCGMKFCFDCGNESHFPISCDIFSNWCDKCTSEGESTKWISTFTRACPNPQCQKPIEKNGGCNHVFCIACKTHFCWECMEMYVNGTHSTCKPNNKQNTSKDSVNSFNVYKNAYQSFDQSITKEKEIPKLFQIAKKKTKEYREENSEQWNNTKPFEDAVVEYQEALRVLKFSYVLYYFAATEKGTHDENFLDFLLNNLQAAVIRLEQMVQSTGHSAEDKKNIKNIASLAKMHSKSLIAYAQEGLTQNAELYRLKL